MSVWMFTDKTKRLPCGCEEVEQIDQASDQLISRWVPWEQCIDHARRCPDDGRCWHNCGEGPCWRVGACGPLSDVFPNDEWPIEIREANQ